MRNIVISMSVCLSVCLSARISQKPHVQMSPNVLYMLLSVTVARCSYDGNVICYVLLVLWTTSCFHIIEQMGRIRNDAYTSSSSPGGRTGGEVCRLRLNLVQDGLGSLSERGASCQNFWWATAAVQFRTR